MASLPANVSLANIADGANIVASDHRNNYSALQVYINALNAILAGGTANQVLQSAGGTTIQWATVTTGYGTAFPGSPTDGQEYVLVDSTTAPTYQWRFRYNASSLSTYKWEFVGGASLFGVSSGTVTLPKAGDYEVTISGTLAVAAVGTTTCTVTPSSGSVSGRNSITNALSASGGSTETLDAAAQFKVAGVSAAATLPWSGSTGSLTNGVIRAVPVRCS